MPDLWNDLVPVMKKNADASPSVSAQPGGEGMQGMAGMPGMQAGNQPSGALAHEFVVRSSVSNKSA